METLTYKGYVGEYELYNDGKDSGSYFAGEISGVKQYAKVLFEGETMEKLTDDFHAAVEDCIQHGYLLKEKSHRVSIPAALYSQLSARAKQNGQSVSAYISSTLASLVL